MNSYLDLEQRCNWYREQLMQEAAAQRLADQAGGPRPSIRRRMAGVLYALAEQLDCSVVDCSAILVGQKAEVRAE
jgi:hypothetical protein